MNRRRNAILAVVGLVAVVALGIFAARPTNSATEVRETVVKYGSFSTKLPETGVIQLPHVVTLPAGVTGTMGRILVQAGERVHAGDLLATILNDQIVSNVRDAEDTAVSADGKARSIAETNAVLPEQNRSAVVQAQASVVAARSALTQAQQDLVAGSQSGLGYGGQTAEEQRLAAESTLSKAATDLREAKRIYDANQFLYDQKGLSRDALMQSLAKYQQAQVDFAQAQSERRILGGTLTRETQVLRDRVRSAQDQLRQAEAALAAAQANAGESKAGDLEAARADAARAKDDLAYARDQAAKLEVRAPFDAIVQSVESESGDPLRPIAPGDSVTAGQPLFALAADDNFIVRTRVDEQDIAGVRVGQHAVVSGEDFGGAKLAGHVLSISPIAQKSDDPSNTSRQVVTTIALDRRLPFLRDGMTVDVDVITHDETHVLTVPIDALHKDDRSDYVFIARDGHAQRVDVHLGAQNDTDAVVISGLHAGDTVISDKNPLVAVGSLVKPAPSPSPAASPS
jgi:RND family efflux transporter MFP subunit